MHIMLNSPHLSRTYGVEMFKLALYTLIQCTKLMIESIW